MLDDDDGQAVAPPEREDRLERLRRLDRGESRHHLVEEEEAGAGGERAGDLQPLAPGERQRAGGIGGEPGEPDLLQHFARALMGEPRRGFAPGPEENPDCDVLQHAEPGEGADDLERAGDAEAVHLVGAEAVDPPAPEADFARSGAQIAGDQREQGGLAGAVRAHQTEDLALFDGHVHRIDRDHPAEAAPHPLELQQAHRRARRQSAIRPWIPFGTPSTKATSSPPSRIM